MADEAAPPPRETPGPDGPFARIVGVFVSPVRTFAAIARKPTWLVPFILWTSMSFLVGQLVTSRMDLRKTIRDSAEQRGQPMTDAQLDAAVEGSGKIAWIFQTIPVVIPALISVIVAGSLWMACHAFGWELKFRQAYGVTMHAYLPGILLSVVLLAMLWNRQTIDPQTIGDILPTNPGILVSARSQKAVHALLSSFDLMSFWTMILLVLGLSSAAKASRGRMAVLVFSLWGIYVLGKAGVAVMFS
jgi:hypothetical protein